MAKDSRFATIESRHEHRRELDAPITAWTRTVTPYEAQAALQSVGVPAGASLVATMLFGDPHIVAREGLQYVETAGVGPTPYPRPAFRLSGTPVPLTNPAPVFGGANSYVFRDLLRMSEAEIAALYEAGITSDLPTGTGGH
jgi:crotonobetainyl-CoA:carnitine CoA-transferase CaiB-like acyl-CoA transferase